MATGSKFDKSFLRVFSRHPSHKEIKNTIVMPKGVVGVLRLGSITSPNYKVDLEINTAKAVENTKDKFIMKKLFEEAGVSSPKFYDLSDLEKVRSEIKFPVIAKRTFRSRGIGMQKIDTPEEFESFLTKFIIGNKYNNRNPYYLEEFKNYSREYRIHVSKMGNYFYSCRKMLKLNYAGSEDNWYRNDSNSVWIREINEAFDKPDSWDVIIQDCQNARQALGLDIGAFDVKVNKKGDWMILEGNSAPSFGEVTSKKYIAELTKIVNQ